MSAQSDPGGTMPSKAEIERRARRARDYVNMALERNHQGIPDKALRWLDKAHAETDWRHQDDFE